jgi:hypothetical protein
MTDIADKIYAATGLTLNAEAAAKIGHMIRLARQEAADEIEKLRAENAKLAASNHAYLSDYQEARGEIEKLRAALKTARRNALKEAAQMASNRAAAWAEDAIGKFLETKWDYESRAEAGEEIASAILARAALGEK